MKKLILFVVVLAAAGGGFYYYKLRTAKPEPTVMTQPFTRGDVVETVGATGTLEAVETVDVGTQVSGVVRELHADFNSIVRKGQVIARLDPQLIQTQIEQQTANVIRAEADLERLRVNLADAAQKLERARQMAEKNLIPRTELETAEVNVRAAQAQIRSAEASVTQARAQLNNQKVNLAYTTITAPIDGIVISRNVDQGQTVAASMNAPTLYVIAADLTKMQVIASVDEADVGKMRPGQAVTFRVDAYPADTFTGAVAQVRLQPTTVQNVVTYSTVISVPNPELKLKPGMTANVSIEIARRNDVLRVANAATRFRPTAEMFAALNQPVPEELQRGRGAPGRGGQRAGAGPMSGATEGPGSVAARGSASTPPAASAQGVREAAPRGGASARSGNAPTVARDRPEGALTATANGEPRGPGPAGDSGRRERFAAAGEAGAGGRGGFDPNMTAEERRQRLEERLAAMAPEDRERFQARLREGRGGRGGFPGREPGARAESAEGAGGAGVRAGGNRAAANGRAGEATGAGARVPGQREDTAGRAPSTPVSKTLSSGATTIDALFAPLAPTETRGTVWLYENRQLKPVRLRLGVSDGTYTEVINERDVPPTAEAVVNMLTGLEQRQAPAGQQNNPLMGPQRGGPGGRGGGTRGRG